MIPVRKGFLTKVYEWIKDNWAIVLLGVATVFLFAKGCEMSNTYEQLFNKYQEQSLSHQTQIEDLQKIQNEEYEKLNEQIKNYIIEVERIEREYKEELEKISSSQKTRKNKIIKKHEEDPDSLAETVYRVFGIPIK